MSGWTDASTVVATASGGLEAMPPALLAIRMEELIIGAIGLLILFGGWIANRLKEMHEARERSETELRSGEVKEVEQTDLDRVAAERREQLRRMARSRAGGGDGAAAAGGGGGGGGSGDLSREELANLSMAERIARARAASRARSSGEGAWHSPNWEQQQREVQRRAQQRDYERRQREEQERRAIQREAETQAEQRRAEARRRAQAQAHAEQRPQRQRTSASQRQRTQQPSRPSSLAPSTRGRRQPAPASIAAGEGKPSVRRGLEDLGRSARQEAIRQMHAPNARTTRLLELLQGPSLRDAILMKEILDRPTALRNPDEAMWRS